MEPKNVIGISYISKPQFEYELNIHGEKIVSNVPALTQRPRGEKGHSVAVDTGTVAQKMEPPKSGSWLRRAYDAVPSRVIIGMQLFFGSWCSYVMRINLSLALITMIHPPKKEETHAIFVMSTNADNFSILNSNDSLPDLGPRYNWSESIQGHLLGAYFYGAMLSHIPGGMLAEYVGPRLVLGVATLVGAFLTVLSPLAAEAGVGWLIAARFVIGLCGGPLYPSLHCVVSQWAPPQEKGKFVWCLLGGTFGMVVTWSIQSTIINALGWPASFYIFGGIVAVWGVLWFLTVYDSPSQHPRITPQERDYITSSIGGNVSSEKRMLPFLSALASCPFLALMFLHFGNLGGLFFLMTEGPKYMSEALDFNLVNSGAYASLPYLMRLIFGFVFSALGDWCLSNPDRNKTHVRKLFVIPSHLLPAVMLALMGYVGKDPALAVSILCVSLGFNGAATVTNLVNHHDLAPSYAGSLYGIMNAIGTSAGFIFPAIVGVILDKENSVEQWRIIFFIGSGLYFVSGLVFLCFGSAETQPWNLKKDDQATS